jgi:hypothetical protein
MNEFRGSASSGTCASRAWQGEVASASACDVWERGERTGLRVDITRSVAHPQRPFVCIARRCWISEPTKAWVTHCTTSAGVGDVRCMSLPIRLHAIAHSILTARPVHVSVTFVACRCPFVFMRLPMAFVEWLATARLLSALGRALVRCLVPAARLGQGFLARCLPMHCLLHVTCHHMLSLHLDDLGRACVQCNH